jgi:hypothetical protein
MTYFYLFFFSLSLYEAGLQPFSTKVADEPLFQTRVGHQKQRTVLSTATFSLIGKPNGWSVLLGKPVEIGVISLIGMGSRASGSGFLSLRVELVLFMINAPRPP